MSAPTLPGRPSGSPSVNTNDNEAIDASIAALPCDIAAVPSLLDDITNLRTSFDTSSGGGGGAGPVDRKARLALLAKARKLVHALETPRETMLKHVGAETACFFSIALGVDIGLFVELAKDGGRPKSKEELAENLGFAVDALGRILRHLAAMGYLVQTGRDTYAPNNFSKSLTIPIVADGYPFYRSVCIAPMLHLHKWFATKSNTTTPTTVRDNPFTFAHQTDQTMFDFMAAFPRYNEQFNHHMGGYRLGRPSWFDESVYPVKSRLFSSSSALSGDEKEDPVLLVDIGGNMGHDLQRFVSAFSASSSLKKQGKLILQDQASVISAAPVGTLEKLGITCMAHDFFTPQPVRGARAYYLHHILHDWPDEKCVSIVKQIKGAMKPRYSRLLINEHVIPDGDKDDDTKLSWEATYLDLYMMILFGSRERTAREWKVLLEDKCGLKILQVWNPGEGVEGIIECEVSV